MKITKEDKCFIKFEELKSGDVFEYDKYIYIKIDNSNFKNAYNLVINATALFEGYENVAKLQAELVIK